MFCVVEDCSFENQSFSCACVVCCRISRLLGPEQTFLAKDAPLVFARTCPICNEAPFELKVLLWGCMAVNPKVVLRSNYLEKVHSLLSGQLYFTQSPYTGEVIFTHTEGPLIFINLKHLGRQRNIQLSIKDRLRYTSQKHGPVGTLRGSMALQVSGSRLLLLPTSAQRSLVAVQMLLQLHSHAKHPIKKCGQVTINLECSNVNSELSSRSRQWDGYHQQSALYFSGASQLLTQLSMNYFTFKCQNIAPHCIVLGSHQKTKYSNLNRTKQHNGNPMKRQSPKGLKCATDDTQQFYFPIFHCLPVLRITRNVISGTVRTEETLTDTFLERGPNPTL